MATKKNQDQRLIGYVRVSTAEQNVDMQVQALRRFGVPASAIWIEKVSAASKKRPELDGAIDSLREGDTLVVWRLDRIARSMTELYRRIEQIEGAGASFRSLTEGFDFGQIGGKLVLAILGAVAEFERNLIRERTSAGVAAAKARGQRFGRAQIMTPAKQDKAEKLLLAGKSTEAVAAAIGCKPGLLYRYFHIGVEDGYVVVSRKLQAKE